MSDQTTVSVCPHGSLRRQCETCDLAVEVIDLRAEFERLRHESNALRNSASERLIAADKLVLEAQAALAAMTAERDQLKVTWFQGCQRYTEGANCQCYLCKTERRANAAAERLAQIEAHAKWLQLLIENSGDPVVVATLQPVLSLLQPVRGAGEATETKEKP